MGIFDGVLLCSDIDGTLTYDGKIPDENVRMIKYFTENGGLFTLSTGRFADFLAENKFEIEPNTYVVSVNGTVISDKDGKEVLYDAKLAPEISERVLWHVLSKYDIELFNTSDIAHRSAPQNTFPYYPANKLIIVMKNEEDAIRLAEDLKDRFKGEIEVSRSWNVGVEVYPFGSGKGIAVKKLKEITGAKTLICAGDFENDIDMIKAADIGYAVGNAAESVKAAADRITVSCADGAIGEIIKITEREITA